MIFVNNPLKLIYFLATAHPSIQSCVVLCSVVTGRPPVLLLSGQEPSSHV